MLKRTSDEPSRREPRQGYAMMDVPEGRFYIAHTMAGQWSFGEDWVLCRGHRVGSVFVSLEAVRPLTPDEIDRAQRAPVSRWWVMHKASAGSVWGYALMACRESAFGKHDPYYVGVKRPSEATAHV